jgi:hypothetical protein
MLSIIFLAGLLAAAGCSGPGKPEQPAQPAEPWRALHVLSYNDDDELAELTRQLPALAEAGINVLILEVSYSFAYQSHPELRQGERQITRAGAARLVEAARAHGIRLIPQFQCLGHQSWAEQTFPLLTVYPEFDLTPGAFPNNEGLYCREWDPLNPEIYPIVFALMDELIDAFEADAIHVGMDEVFLLGSEHAPSTKGMDPAVLFAGVVNRLHEHLVEERGVEMLMWGDRLIDADVYPYGEWEAAKNGTAPAVDMIPRDIIICDWHYEPRADGYPSVPMFLEKGFRVLPTSWKNLEGVEDLIAYSAAQRSPRMLGHLFTTWSKQDELAAYPPLQKGMALLEERE